MKSDPARDDAAIVDILARARRAVFRVGPIGFERFAEDLDAQDVAIRCLEVIGEAAGRVSQEGRDAHPQVPWVPITRMRNRLVHDYGNIDLEEVWRTVSVDLPRLIAALEDAPDG